MITGYVNGQSLKLSAPVLASDTIDYQEARFVFMRNDWDDLSVIKAIITNAETDEVYAIPLTDGCIRKEDHLNLSDGLWEVHLVGSAYEGGELVERITTVPDFLRVEHCGDVDGEPLPEIPATDVERLEAAIEELRQNGGGTGGGAEYDIIIGFNRSDVLLNTIKPSTFYVTAGSLADVKEKVLSGGIPTVAVRSSVASGGGVVEYHFDPSGQYFNFSAGNDSITFEFIARFGSALKEYTVKSTDGDIPLNKFTEAGAQNVIPKTTITETENNITVRFGG